MPPGRYPSAPANRHAVADDVEAEHAALAGGRVEKAKQQTDGRALAGAVRSEEPEDLALAHADVERLERPDRWRRCRPKPRQQGLARPGPMPVVLGETRGLDRCISGSVHARAADARAAADLFVEEAVGRAL